jgi:hypothetical protein
MRRCGHFAPTMDPGVVLDGPERVAADGQGPTGTDTGGSHKDDITDDEGGTYR